MVENYNKNEIGQRIKNIRATLGLNMEEFGKKISPPATKGTISNWENGNYLPNNERLRQITEIGNVSMTYLLEGKMTFDDLPAAEQERLRREHLISLTNVDGGEYSTLINYLDDLHNTFFDTTTVSTLASTLRYCFIVEPNNIDDDPIKIRFLRYIIDQLNNYLTGEHESTSPDIVLADLVEKLDYIIRK